MTNGLRIEMNNGLEWGIEWTAFSGLTVCNKITYEAFSIPLFQSCHYQQGVDSALEGFFLILNRFALQKENAMS
jgi:hypothetical protein